MSLCSACIGVFLLASSSTFLSSPLFQHVHLGFIFFSQICIFDMCTFCSLNLLCYIPLLFVISKFSLHCAYCQFTFLQFNSFFTPQNCSCTIIACFFYSHPLQLHLKSSWAKTPQQLNHQSSKNHDSIMLTES
jgi:hypothetical protein